MRCYQCMKEFKDGYEVCPHCGYIVDSRQKELYHLAPGTVLQKRYMIGVVIGYGGFGVVYKAWDNQLEKTVAIKEYFPVSLVNRVPGTAEVIIYSKNNNQEYNAGLERFLDEARNMARFSKYENIVDIYNFFEENQTGYIVMEFLDGLSLKDFLKSESGRIELKYASEIILAVARVLQVVHKEHIIHRDISPDNIFLLKDGKIKVMDLGAARQSVNDDKSHSIVLKPGYAPPEQYQRRGKQGPWVDIYALGATMYRAITGVVPEESVNRKVEDTLVPPKRILPKLPDYINNAIMRAMSLDITYRFQTMEEFMDAITNKKKTLALQEEIKRRKRKRFISLVAVIAVLLAVGGVIGYQIFSVKNGDAVTAKLQLWLCVEDGEDADALTDYYKDVSDEVFGKDYPKATVEIHALPENEYESALLGALDSGKEPIIYESTYASDQVLNKGKELDDLIKQIKEDDTLDSYYFLNHYRDYVPEGKRLPIGFYVPVAYTLQREYPASIAAGEIENEADYLTDESGREDVVSRFADGQCTYLIGRTTDLPYLEKAVYGTYEEQKENIAGKVNIVVLSDEQPGFTTAFSMNKDCSAREEQAMSLYLRYLISYQEQYLLHSKGNKDGVQEANGFSVNRKADQEYRSKIKSAFSVLDEMLNQI